MAITPKTKLRRKNYDTTNRYSLYASYGQVFNSIYAINNIGADEIGSINNLAITDIKEVNGVD